MRTTFGESFLTWLETEPATTGAALDYADAIDQFANAARDGDVTALQVSATLIRAGQTLIESSGAHVSYEYRLSGAGLSPVTSLSALLDAIDQGVANGSFTQISILRAGVKILGIDFSAGGYTVTSGGQSFIVAGSLPGSFDSLFTLAGLIGQVPTVGDLADADRTQFFSDLSAFGISGLTVMDGTTKLFDFQITATHLHLALEGLSIDVTGTFPNDFGLLVETVWEAAQNPDIDPTQLTHLGATNLVTKDGTTTLVSITQIDQQMTNDFKVDGKLYSELLLDQPKWFGSSVTTDLHGHITSASYDALLQGASGSVASILSGLDGKDTLYGYGGRDLLYGGSGRDMLYGGAGTDTLFGGTDGDSLTGGLGRDVLYGGTGNDILQGDADNDMLYGGTGNDLLFGGSGTDFLYGGIGADKLEGGAGNDVLKGDSGNDRFIFNLQTGPIDADTILSFDVAHDKLAFDGPGTTYTALGAAGFVSTYASVVGGNVVIQLDATDKVVLQGINTLAGLADALILS